MTSAKYWISLLMIVFLFSSCEKVIELDLNDAEKKYVIEANIADEPGTARVVLTQTKNFDEDNQFPGVSGATVRIREEGQPALTFTETSTGVYTHPTLAAVPGRTYELEVTLNGQTFEASCRTPQAVEMDTLFVTDELLFGESQKIANVRFRDPSGRGHNYRFIQFINDVKEKQILVINDDYIDGREITSKLFYFADEDEGGIKIKSGDNLKVEFQMIDQPLYLYWFSLLRSATGGSQQATPANPVSNIRGGALGYFSAHVSRSRTITVP